MLSGKFELIRTLGLPLPEKDYAKLIIEPRNAVIHKANTPDHGIAYRHLIEAAELLQLFSPTLSEQ